MEEGDYFTWTLEEVREVLDDEHDVKLVRLAYGVEERGDMNHAPDRNVLHQVADPEDIAAGTGDSPAEIAEELERIRGQLFRARREREQPPVDPTVYADWNGLAIQALLRLDALHEDPPARKAALRALDRLLGEAFEPDEGFAHAVSEEGPRVWGLVEDQANLLAALIEAYNATQEERYLEALRQTAEVIVDGFVREDGLVRFNREEDEPAPPGDQPTPSASAQIALQLPRVARLTGEERYREVGRDVLDAVAGRVDEIGGLQTATLVRAARAHLEEPPHVVVTGDPDEAEAFLERARRAPVATLTMLHADEPQRDGVPEEAREAARTFVDESVAIVCWGRACQVAEEPAEVDKLLAS
jgi:uncharacterized protein YyaL (SSP411 family)